MRITRFSFLLLPALALAACQSTSGEWQDDDTGLLSETESPSAEVSTPVAQAPTPAANPEQDARSQVDVRIQKRQVLARNFVDQGDDAFARGDFKGAAQLYAEAMQLDPDSRDARDGLRRCEAQLSGNAWDTDSAEDRLAQSEVRWAQRHIQVEGLVSDGDRAMASGDFETAVRNFQAAELALRTNPALAGGSLDHSLVSAKLQEATQARDDAAAAVKSAQKAAAEAQAAAEAKAQTEYQENRIRTLFQDANASFSEGFYERALSTLDAVLELDPRNGDALRLREVANEAWHDKRERDTTGRFREEWKRTFEEMKSLLVPPKSSIEYDVDYWRNVVQHRQPLESVVATKSESPEDLAVRKELETTRIQPTFDNTVEEIASNLAAYTRVNFVVTRAVREDLDEDTKTVRLQISRPMPVSRILDLIESQTGGQVKFKIEHGVVKVMSAEEASGNQVLQKYEVRDIVRPVKDFVGTDVNLSPSGGIEQVDEELPEREATILTEDDLLSAIQENIEPDAWDDTATISVENGTLIVFANPGIQKRIQQLLSDLRRSSNVMVEIKVRFLKVEDSFLQDIGVDFRGLGNQATSGLPGQGASFVFDDFGTNFGPSDPGTLGTDNTAGAYFREASDDVNIIARTENLYDSGLGSEQGLVGSGGLSMQWTWLDDTQVETVLRAVEKSRRSEVMTEPKLMVFNTQRATLTVANQVSYVGDFDVEIAQAAAIADPIVRVARDGVFLDVRPVVSADRRFTYIDVRPTVATLKRPIPTFQTSLGTGSPVTMQLPELELQKIRTRVMIPDGGTLLLGGMKIANQQDLESGVPILNRIPIVSFFFSRKGQYESYQKLIILLTARIILPEEFEPSAEPGSAN